MKRLDAPLITPIYAKTSPQADWPPDPAFFALAGDGLFLCRNTRFYRSCVRARRPPAELAPQRESLVVNFPKIATSLLEQAVGFFDWAYRERGAESILLLAWNETRQEVELIAPDQVASSYRNARGEAWAMSVRYEFPHPLAEDLTIFADAHSHCEMSAHASYQDQVDEEQFNGLHIVAGRLDQEPPQWHVEAAVDGARFAVDQKLVFEGYRRRDHQFPAAWRARHSVQYTGYQGPGASTVSNYSYGSGDDGAPWSAAPKDYYDTKTTWGGKPLLPGRGVASSHQEMFFHDPR